MRATSRDLVSALLTWSALALPLHAVELGALVIRAEPGAEVIWQGVQLGQTDDKGVMEISEIPLGSYDIEIRVPGHPGERFSVDVEEGSQILKVSPPEQVVVEAAATSSDVVMPAEASTPDPLRSSEISLGTVYFLLGFSILVLGAIWLAHLHSRREQAAAEPEGPAMMVDAPAERERRSPEFYDEIKRRENALDERGPAGSTAPRGPVLVKDVTPDSPSEEKA